MRMSILAAAPVAALLAGCGDKPIETPVTVAPLTQAQRSCIETGAAALVKQNLAAFKAADTKTKIKMATDGVALLASPDACNVELTPSAQTAIQVAIILAAD